MNQRQRADAVLQRILDHLEAVRDPNRLMSDNALRLLGFALGVMECPSDCTDNLDGEALMDEYDRGRTCGRILLGVEGEEEYGATMLVDYLVSVGVRHGR